MSGYHEQALNAPKERAKAFDDGLQLGSSVVQREWVRSAVGALLDALGKDAADGPIDLGAAGRWVNHDDGCRPATFVIERDARLDQPYE